MRSVDMMMSRPGVYVVVMSRGTALVEVDDTPACHQLEFKSGTYQRDGELRAGSWNLEAIVSIEGPFARSAHTALKESA